MTLTQQVIARFTESQPFFIALGDERRQAIVILLLEAKGPCTVGQITERLQLSQPAVSHHLKILRDVRLLTVEHRGAQRWYGLNARECAELLAPMKELVELINECTAATITDPSRLERKGCPEFRGTSAAAR